MTDTATTGHNSELTPQERSALRMDHIRKLLEIEARMKPLLEERKAARGNAKTDGFKLSEIDAGMRLAQMEDTSIFVAEIKELVDIARAFNALPPGDQGELFPDRRPAKEMAGDEGYAAGMQGKNAEPPYGADSPEGQEWLRRWHEAQEVMRDALQSAMEKKNAAKDSELVKGDPEFEDPGEMPEAAE